MTIVRHSPRPRSRRVAAVTIAISSAVVAALLAACGGAGDDAPASNASAAASTVTSKRDPIAPLFDDRGRPIVTLPSDVPADTAARTRQGLYASRDQLEWEELTMGITSIVIDVDAEGGTDAAVRRARMLRDWHGNDGMARVYYVRGRDHGAAVRVVDALSDEGFGWVYLVR